VEPELERADLVSRSRPIKHTWDLLVIGAGITGAGIFREATRLGYRTLLIDQCDFCWGTSSRSSKLVHGGFRYLKEGKVGLTRASVGEREQLLHEGPGLIDPLGFLMTIYKRDTPGKWTMKMGLTIYDLLALRWNHETYDPEDFQMLAPHIARDQLVCGFRYGDAQTDDARLVMRLIKEGAAQGGTAINYLKAEELLWKEDHASDHPLVSGAILRDQVTGRLVQSECQSGDQRHRCLGRRIASQSWCISAHPPTARQPSDLSQLACAGSPGNHFMASIGWTTCIHLPLGRHHSGWHNRCRPSRIPR
jgi:glycerol-3-phosphate dehydrogenase